ncbi:MAG TPA: hypothetical protein VNA44_09970 [Burkholderiaceae bacterium]|nr:hypothetical protein [Burkholderiaceae bacterium]
MNRSIARRSLIPPFQPFRALGATAIVAASLLASLPSQAQPGPSPEQRRQVWERMTPEQRREMGPQMSPEQREMARRRMTPEPDMRGQIPPDERQAMRQRFIERQQNNRPPIYDQNVPPPRRQLSPEERQRLREQVEQAQRDVYRRGDGGNRGPNK